MGDLAGTRSFFGPRAAGWERRFPDDGPRYRQAVRDLAPPVGGAVADIACGTGRALPELREAVGPGGAVFGVDVTEEMLAEAVTHGRDKVATLVLADAMRLPFTTGSLDAVFVAGLFSHLTDANDGLRELARVTRQGGRIAIFHPISRAALAARHGRELSTEDFRAEPNIRAALANTGWHTDSFEDGDARYLVLASRTG